MPKKLVFSPSPITEPVTLQEAKDHLRVVVADDDDYISGLITECRVLIENATERALIAQTWDVFFDHFPHRPWLRGGVGYMPPSCDTWPEGAQYPASAFGDHDYLELPLPPLQQVTQITYVDPTGATPTLDPSQYLVDDASQPARIYPAYGTSWPATRAQRNAIAVRIVTGYPDAASVPPTMKGAIKKFVAHFYENREPVSAVAGVTPYELPLHLQDELSYERDASSWI